MTDAPAADCQVVVVGASAAGLGVVDGLRRLRFGGAITLVGEESHLPYDRPPLSKQVLSGEWAVGRLPLRTEDEVESLGLDLRLGVVATGLDPAGRKVILETGEALTYDRLVIATGVRPRTLPGAPARVLRTQEDALRLRERLRPGKRLVVVGGGFLGTEVAATARGLGCEVTVLEPAPVPLAHAVGAEVGGLLTELHLDRGVDLRTGIGVSEVRPGGVRLGSGEVIEADDVLVAVGSVPNTEWLAGSGLDISDGVLCDAHSAAVGVEDVYAAGDVARWHNPLFGLPMRIEHRTNAGEQGLAVARAILVPVGERAEFAPVPYFWSDQYEVRIQAYGYLRGHDEASVLEGSRKERRLLVAYRTGDRLAGVLGVGMPPKKLRTLRQLIGGPWAEAIAVADPDASRSA